MCNMFLICHLLDTILCFSTIVYCFFSISGIVFIYLLFLSLSDSGISNALSHSPTALPSYSALFTSYKKKKAVKRKAVVVRTEWVDSAAAVITRCSMLVGTFQILLLKVGSLLGPCSSPVHHRLIVIPLSSTHTQKRNVLNVDSQFSNAAWKWYKIFVDLVFPHSPGHCEQTHYLHWIAQLPWKLITCLFIQKEKGSWPFKQNGCYERRVVIPSHKERVCFSYQDAHLVMGSVKGPDIKLSENVKQVWVFWGCSEGKKTDSNMYIWRS